MRAFAIVEMEGGWAAMASVSWGAKEAGGRSRIRRTISLISFPILLDSEKTAERDEAFSALMHS